MDTDPYVYKSLLLNVRPRFGLGRILATPGALALIAQRRAPVLTLIARHVSGDWGDVPTLIALSNNEALRKGGELMSFYTLTIERKASPAERSKTKTQICMLTAADRSMTIFLTRRELKRHAISNAKLGTNQWNRRPPPTRR